MAEIINEEMFRPAKKNGFDREDVLNKVQAIKEAAAIEKNALQEKLDAALKDNEELKAKAADLQNEVDRLKKDISEKYQSYIDNYEMIGSLIFDAKVQSKNIISDAEKEKETILKDAEAQSLILVAGAKKTAEEETAKAKADMDAMIEEAQLRCTVIKDRTGELMGSLNDIRQKLECAFNDIQNIADSNDALKEAVEEAKARAAEAEEAAKTEVTPEDDFEEYDELDEPDEEDLDIEDTHEIEFGQLPEELRETPDNEN